MFSLRDLESLGIPASELHMVTEGMGSVSPDGLMTTRPYQSGVQQVLEVLSKRASMDTGKSSNENFFCIFYNNKPSFRVQFSLHFKASLRA